MSETITLHALDLSGETTLRLFLRKDDGTLLNTGGDDLTEIGSSGVFTATLAEARTGLGDLSYRVCLATETADNLLIDGFLPETETTIGASGTAALDPASVTAVQSGLATSAALTTVGTNVSSILGKLSGITLLKNWLALIMGKTADTGTRAEVNATTAGAGYNETTDSQEAIRDRGDSAWISGGGGGTTTIVTLQAAAGISPGVIVGPSEPLVIGDDYLTVMNRSVRINLLDANGDPAEVVFGTYSLEDSGISIQLLLAKSGKPSTTALIVGTCTFFPAVGSVPPYLIVEFTRTETAKAIPGPYDMQVEAIWNDGKTVTFAPYGQIEFTRNIGRRT